MNRFLRAFFWAASGLLCGYAVMFGRFYQSGGVPLLRTKMLWVAVAAAVFCAVVAWRFSLRARFKVFLALLVFFVAELLLQALGWLGVLPVVATKLKAPYARVYWSSEGRGNSIRNRAGWYAPEFDLKASRRIAFIGDSQVEALEVHRSRNQAVVLQTLLKRQSPEWSVLGLGSHGTGPAYYIDVLDYAQRHFQPAEAIVVVSGGSDVTEALQALTPYPPDYFIFYDLAPDGSLVLNPASAGVRAEFQWSLESSHRSLFFNLPAIVNSHCMTLQVLNTIREKALLRRQRAALAARAAQFGGTEGAEYERIGFNPAVFALDPKPEARRAMAVMLGQLRRCKEICDAHHITLRVFFLSSFPKAFYDSQHGRDWTMQIGQYDYLQPEREVVAFAHSNSIPVLGLGDYAQRRGLDVQEIRSLFFAGGVGHLTEKGHRFCAEALYETFYGGEPPMK